MLKDELMEAMHEFVEDYCREQTGEVGDMIYYHDMIDNPKNRTLGGSKCYAGTEPNKLAEDWLCFTESFQEYISNL